MRARLLLASVLLGVAGCKDNRDPNGWMRHHDLRGFSIAYPVTWESEQRVKDGILYIYQITSPHDKEAGVCRSLSVVVYRNEPYESMEALARARMRELAGGRIAYQGVLEIIDANQSQWTVLDHERSYHDVYSCERVVDETRVRMKVYRWVTIHGSSVYQLTAYCSPEQTHEDEIRGIAQSLRFE